MLTGLQIRTARELLGWPAWKLAEKAKMAIRTIERAETSLGEAPLAIAQENHIRQVLVAAGVEFINGGEPGVKLKAKGSGK